jgi:Transposase zinc-binding domain
MPIGHYERRAPEKTLLYQTIQRHFESFVQLFEERSGGVLPSHIRREFEDYLACGIPAHGFLRLICTECHESSILPFSCKRRGFCPSCGARKMADSAAFLADWVLPDSVGYRQYVLTVPIPLRFWMARGGRLLGEIYRIFSSEVRSFVESHCEAEPAPGRPIASGTVTFIQRFGDGLRYNVLDSHYSYWTGAC